MVGLARNRSSGLFLFPLQSKQEYLHQCASTVSSSYYNWSVTNSGPITFTTTKYHWVQRKFHGSKFLQSIWTRYLRRRSTQYIWIHADTFTTTHNWSSWECVIRFLPPTSRRDIPEWSKTARRKLSNATWKLHNVAARIWSEHW